MQQPILTVPDPVLREICTPVTDFTPSLMSSLKILTDTLKAAKNPEGVGLSFPQLGILTRGFATYIDHRLKIYLNPIILDQSDEQTLGPKEGRPLLEGCLSIPHLYGPVWRPKKIHVQTLDEKGKSHDISLSNFAARVFLHELDHLDGVLFTDYTKKDNLPLYFHDTEKDEFVEIKDPASVIRW